MAVFVRIFSAHSKLLLVGEDTMAVNLSIH
jgi:hypothetical protein